MNGPTMAELQRVAADTYQLGAWLPVPEQGLLAANSYLIRGRQPVLIDTGLAALRDDYIRQLREVVDLEDLRWIWLTHMDPDHTGNLETLLRLAPQASVVTTFLGAGKLNLLGLQPATMHILNAGDRLDAGDRELVAAVPPTFDAPETVGCFDSRSRAFFSSDCFGGLVQTPTHSGDELSSADLQAGLQRWCEIDTPWLSLVDRARLAKACWKVASYDPHLILSSHLPPVTRQQSLLFDSVLQAAGQDKPALKRAS